MGAHQQPYSPKAITADRAGCRWTAISEQLHFVPPQRPESKQERGGTGVVELIESHQNRTSCDGFSRADFRP